MQTEDPHDEDEPESKNAFNPYLDSSLTNKFITSFDNEQFIQKHDSEIPNKSKIASAHDSFTLKMDGQKKYELAIDATRFFTFCEKNNIYCTYSECWQYIQHFIHLYKLEQKVGNEYWLDAESGAPIIIDNGSGTMKFGFSNEPAPRGIFPSVIGRRKISVVPVYGSKECNDKVFIGNQAQSSRGILKLNYPIEQSYITSWDDIEKIWYHIFYNELRIQPEEHCVLLTEAPLNPKANREKTTQIMFETFNVPGMYLANSSVLALAAYGMTTGIVLDCGATGSHTTAVYEGYALRYSTLRLGVAGRDVTDYLRRILWETGNSFKHEIVRDIKERCGYVAESYENELMKNHNYELPDGTRITVGAEAFRCAEVLFQPKLMGKESVGIHELVYKAIIKCPIDLRRTMYENVVLSGGTTMFPGFDVRLAKEMTALLPANVKIKVKAAADRKFAVWKGGAMITTLSQFEKMWISKDDYDEAGPGIVNRKCF